MTTKDSVDFVKAAGPRMAATITAHHLLWNRNAIFQGGIRPHAYCLPVLKREEHRKALVAAATGDNAQFFLGTDSAPHARHTKETTCGCAGVYTSHAGIELYAEAFDNVGALDRLEAFASLRGPKFYGLPANKDRITLEKAATQVPADCRSARTRWCRCAQARRSLGASSAEFAEARSAAGLPQRVLDDLDVELAVLQAVERVDFRARGTQVSAGNDAFLVDAMCERGEDQCEVADVAAQRLELLRDIGLVAVRGGGRAARAARLLTVGVY